jgi:hypothetical protein
MPSKTVAAPVFGLGLLTAACGERPVDQARNGAVTVPER